MKTSFQMYGWIAAGLLSAVTAALSKPSAATFWIAASALGICVLAFTWLILGDGQPQKGALSRNKIGPASAQDLVEMRRLYLHR